MTYRDYFLRTTDANWPTLISLGVQLGVIAQDGDEVSAIDGGQWDYIGQIVRDGSPVTDGNGNVYLHANLRTKADLRALAESNPAMAGALANLSLYFVTDENGQPKRPENPARVFF